MTTDKARKRAVRTRMARTGESYTAARRHVVAPMPVSLAHDDQPAGPPAVPMPASDESLVRATGHGWEHWLRALGERGVEGFSHRNTAAWLRAELGIDGWWSQTITVGFERARGLRAVHETTHGFSVGVTKTMPIAAARVFRAFVDEGERDAWLEPGTLRLRTATPNRTARFDFRGGPSRVVVGLDPKGDSKTMVAVQHEGLASADEVEAMRAFWKERLPALARRLA